MPKSKSIRYKWSIATCFFNDPVSIGNPGTKFHQAITWKSVTDVPAGFVADPFMVQYMDKWYLFFEVLNTANSRGEIGMAHSPDLKNWTYDKIVLREDFHLSYPSIIQHNNKMFMVPESRRGGGVRLYEAKNFPYGWQFKKMLLPGNYADPTIIYHENSWWMFVLKGTTELHLFIADDLEGPWLPHPQRPLAPPGLSITRPAGFPVSHNGKLLRFAQDGVPVYGSSVRAFEIDLMSATHYKEHEIAESPILKGSGKGWNAATMHHIDAHLLPGGGWVAVVDGSNENFNLVRRIRRVLKQLLRRR